MKEFNNIKEMEKYYDKKTNLFYIEDDIKINFDLMCDWNINARDIDAWDIKARNINARDIKALNINAWDIKARDIDARDIKALNINAWDIDAENISFWAVCFAYRNIQCTSIKGKRENSRHFVLDGELVVRGEEVE